MPRSASGRLIVVERTSVYITQLYLPSTSAEIFYVRNYNNGTWTSWKEIISSINTTQNVSSSYMGLLSLRRSCGTVSIEGLLALSSSLSTGWNDIVTVPEEYRPSSSFNFFAYDDSNLSKTISGIINTSGVIRLYKTVNGATPDNLRISFTFVV